MMFGTDRQKRFTELQEKISKYLLQDNALVNSIYNQRNFLNKKGRNPIAIFLSYDALMRLIESFSVGKDAEDNIKFIMEFEKPLFTVMDTPLFVSNRLKASAVMVVGETEWKDFNFKSRSK